MCYHNLKNIALNKHCGIARSSTGTPLLFAFTVHYKQKLQLPQSEPLQNIIVIERWHSNKMLQQMLHNVATTNHLVLDN